VLPVKFVGGRASSSQVNWSAPLPLRLTVIRPPLVSHQERGFALGGGNSLYDRSKPGTGLPGAPPAPLSKRTRIGGCASNIAFAEARSG
jgi:hypothetical protein